MMKYKGYKIGLLLILLGSFVANLSHGSNIEDNESEPTGKWKCDISIGGMGPFTTFLYFSYAEGKNSFIGYSAKNADIRMLGFFKAVLGRLAGKLPKKGILIRLSNGNLLAKSDFDSLYADIQMPMLGTYKLAARKDNDTIAGFLKDGNKKVGYFNGHKINTEYSINYDKLFGRIIDTTQQYIFNPDIIHSSNWQKFERKLKRVSGRVKDDAELFLAFNLRSQELPFSHYRFFIHKPGSISQNNRNISQVSFEKIDEHTGYMNIKSFAGSAKEMDSVFKRVFSYPYKNLIVDLRKNSGGGINSALVFGKYLIDEETDVGVFLGKKWFEKYDGIPNQKVYAELPISNAITTKEFIRELEENPAIRLVISPSENTFKGSLFILTSNRTASTSEPIVYYLKKQTDTKVIGQKTSGSMLSAIDKKVMDKYHIIVPIADFYTADGQRIEQKGVVPDVKIDTSKALEFTLDELIGN